MMDIQSTLSAAAGTAGATTQPERPAHAAGTPQRGLLRRLLDRLPRRHGRRPAPDTAMPEYPPLAEVVAYLNATGIRRPILARQLGDRVQLSLGCRPASAAKLPGYREVPVHLAPPQAHRDPAPGNPFHYGGAPEPR